MAKNYDKLNLNPHKEARFAMFHWHDAYAKTGLGSMQFFETYLSDSDRNYCKQAVKEILASRDRKESPKQLTKGGENGHSDKKRRRERRTI